MNVVRYLLLLLFFVTGPLRAADTPLEFEDPQKQQRYQELLEEIRCLVCQNQSLADSHADLAQDLRREVHIMIGEDKSNEVITGFLVDRYGDFVLYRPPLKGSTWLLWFGPFILLLAAFAAVALFVRSRRNAEEGLSPEQHERATRMLNDDNDNKY